jgi:hypothetical protein
MVFEATDVTPIVLSAQSLGTCEAGVPSNCIKEISGAVMVFQTWWGQAYMVGVIYSPDIEEELCKSVPKIGRDQSPQGPPFPIKTGNLKRRQKFIHDF